MKGITGTYFGPNVVYFPTQQWIYQLSTTAKLNRSLEYLFTLRWEHWEIWKGQEVQVPYMVKGKRLKLKIQIYPEIPIEITNDPQRLFFVLSSRTNRGGKFKVINEAPEQEAAIQRAMKWNMQILTETL